MATRGLTTSSVGLGTCTSTLMFAVGDQCIFRWVGHRTGEDGKLEHYRGIDVLRVQDGEVAEKLVYTKR